MTTPCHCIKASRIMYEHRYSAAKHFTLIPLMSFSASSPVGAPYPLNSPLEGVRFCVPLLPLPWKSSPPDGVSLRTIQAILAALSNPTAKSP